MKQLLKKEIIDILRNKRALYEMILIPLLMTPVLSIFFPFLLVFLTQKFFQEQIMEKIPYKKVEKTSISRKEWQNIFVENKKNALDLLEEIKKSGILQIVDVKNPENALKKQSIQLHLIIPPDFRKKLNSGKKIFLKLNLKIVNLKTIIAFLKLNRIMENYNQKISNIKITALQVRLNVNNLTLPSEFTGFILGLLLPIFILFWLMMGGNSIAIDLFTAEKERKTLEFLFLLPVKRKTILFAKFLITILVSLITVFLAITGIALSIILFWNYLPSVWQIYLKESPISFPSLLLFFIFIILLSSILNWFQLFFSIVSKSVKEVEYYLYPLVMVIILPGIISLFSELSQIKNSSFLVPLLNICYIFKEILINEYNIYHILIAGLSSLFYIFLLYQFVLYIFQKEKVIFTN